MLLMGGLLALLCMLGNTFLGGVMQGSGLFCPDAPLLFLAVAVNGLLGLTSIVTRRLVRLCYYMSTLAVVLRCRRLYDCYRVLR